MRPQYIRSKSRTAVNGDEVGTGQNAIDYILLDAMPYKCQLFDVLDNSQKLGSE